MGKTKAPDKQSQKTTSKDKTSEEYRALLRRLLITPAFSPDAPPNVKRVLGVDVEFEFAVSDPNKDVEVTAPQNVRPYSDLLGD